MLYKTILFDLDGTITDSGEGIIHSVVYALKKMDLKVPKQTELYSFIGPPLNESFKKMYRLDTQSTEQAVEYYRDYYKEKGMYENRVYKGVTELLEALTKAGCRLYIATSKPEVYAKKILDHFGLASYFKGVYGASLNGERSKKGDVIHYALDEAKITNLKETVMIGDRSHDIEGAKENELASIGVLYGFGDAAELEAAGASIIVKTPREIENIIIKS
ncbi:HAD family hydrolase [Enterococcus quebecensis]|uniref:Hydrolase n=1 Tax=Enterococcus quebecensis TaxID=903983 RepID=A0A1E5GPN2_9ENTE|nr:HAD family hydrolase [Enterococcus quebecensis]OEG14657.1 hydrolase [Enterococcus quebecensis]OJG73292.1 HAD hydrolase, family IA [Enterococcus quebecensis]